MTTTIATVTAPANSAQEPDKTSQGQEEILQKPNVRPYGQERVPDKAWTLWRLRSRRPELDPLMEETFPDINRQLYDDDQKAIEASLVARPRVQKFKKRSFKDLKNYKANRLAFRSMNEVHDGVDKARRKQHPRRLRGDLDREDHDRYYSEPPNEWYDQMSADLFHRVWEFASNTFGQECFADRCQGADWTSLWLQHLPKEFVYYASKVARGDPSRSPKPDDPNSWEHLFLAQDSRTLLLVGLIGKILGENVFGSLLFGVNEQEKLTLDSLDASTAFEDDGYRRTFARSKVAKSYLVGDLRTVNFWDEVDRVTMEILNLLIPLINLLGNMKPDGNWPPLTEVHQSIHNIVAEAAWLTNGMRISTSCWWIEFPQPGQLWDLHQEHAIGCIWEASKTEAEKFNNLPVERWNEERERDWQAYSTPSWKQLYTKLAKGKKRLTYDEWFVKWVADNPRPTWNTRRTAKVQIAMWPWIDRYRPVRQAASDGHTDSGEEIVSVMKAQVVYYAGDESDEGEDKERLTLQEHVRSGRQRQRRQLSLTGMTSMFVVLALLLALMAEVRHQMSLHEDPAGRLLRWRSVTPTVVLQWTDTNMKASVPTTAPAADLLQEESTLFSSSSPSAKRSRPHGDL